MPVRILIVCDDTSLSGEFFRQLDNQEQEALVTRTGSSALESLSEQRPAVVVLDHQISDGSAMDLLDLFAHRNPRVPVVMLTPQGDTRVSVECIRQGAHDFVPKPLAIETLRDAVTNALNDYRPFELKSIEPIETALPPFIGESRQVREAIDLLHRAAEKNVTILLEGELGTGKELAARTVHQESARCDGPFVTLNCGAVPPGLVESEMLGHETGTASGAAGERPGRFEQASGGTLYLDDVSAMPLDVQAQLLRILQNRSVERIGARRSIGVDVRVIAGTRTNLEEEVRSGRFREDLFFRLSIFPVMLPALRDRKADFNLLIDHFVGRYAGQHQIAAPSVEHKARKSMSTYHWPGNVEELQNVIERAVILTSGSVLDLDSLPGHISQMHPPGVPDRLRHIVTRDRNAGFHPPQASTGTRPGPRLPEDIIPFEDQEKRIIHHALKACDWNVTETAERLRLGRATVYRKMEKYGLDSDRRSARQSNATTS